MSRIKNNLKVEAFSPMEKEKSVHPITILKSLRQIAFLLLIPLIRGLIVAITGGGMMEWLEGARVDIVIIVCGILIVVLYWSQNKYYFTKEGIILKKGIFLKQKSLVSYDNLSFISLSSPVILKYLGVLKFRGDTHSGNALFTDFSLYINEEDGDILRNWFLTKHEYTEDLPVYRPKSFYIFFFSAFLSNSAVGAVIAYTFFSQGGKILNIEINQQLLDTVSLILGTVAMGISPALAIIAILIVIGWIIAFIKLLLRYARLRATRMEEALWISGGIFTKTDNFLQIKDISYLDIRQSVLTKIFRLAITYIYCAGYGKDADTAPVFIPAASKKETNEILKKYLGEFKLSKVSARPAHWFTITSFIGLPLGIALSTLLISFLFSLVFVRWKNLIVFAGFILSLLFFWMVLIKIFDYISSGIGADSDTLTLNYSSTFSLHTVILPKNKITKISIFEKGWHHDLGLCDVIIYSYSEGKKAHLLRGLSKKEAVLLFKKNKM